MTSSAIWMFGLALAYTLLLIVMSQIAKKKAQAGEDFFVGGRKFSRWTVAFCITGLFSGSTYIAILELSYLTGISALWYGVAELTHVLIIALVLIGPFRKRMMVTISGLIGDKYGRAAKGIAGGITAITFPMWSVATALAFASCINAITGMDMLLSVVITAALMYVFLSAGGMWSVAMTQTANFFVFMIMFAVAIYAIAINPGFDAVAALLTTDAKYGDLTSVGLQTILAWFGTFLINVLLAQAAFQMALSCKTADEGRKGLLIAGGFNVIFIAMGVLVGAAAAIVTPGNARGLVAVPIYLMETLPGPMVGLFTLGIWACALGWGAPCQFSGATSLGRDVGSAIWPDASDAKLVKLTRLSLLALTCLMILFGYLRSEQAAWWNIFAWTARNGATFAPMVAALFWSVATPRGSLTALIAGCGAGLVWNWLGGWAVGSFYLKIHPVWVAMAANIIGMTVVSLAEKGWYFISPSGGLKALRNASVGLALVLTVALVAAGPWFYQTGLWGMTAFLVVLCAWVALIFSTERQQPSMI